jgi:hypothetical protein
LSDRLLTIAGNPGIGAARPITGIITGITGPHTGGLAGRIAAQFPFRDRASADDFLFVIIVQGRYKTLHFKICGVKFHLLGHDFLHID